jgi:hypothetical protein
MTTELSTDLISHKLIIKWIWTKYITKKFAEWIFNQLSSKEWNIIIANPENLTYIQKYRSEVILLPLDWEDKTIEDLIYLSWLSESKKEEVRQIIEQRKIDKKPITETIIKNIIESLFTKI